GKGVITMWTNADTEKQNAQDREDITLARSLGGISQVRQATRQPIAQLGKQYAVIDLDTGTVLGTNLRLVEMPLDPADQEEILSSDSAAHDYAQEFGIPLYAG